MFESLFEKAKEAQGTRNAGRDPTEFWSHGWTRIAKDCDKSREANPQEKVLYFRFAEVGVRNFQETSNEYKHWGGVAKDTDNGKWDQRDLKERSKNVEKEELNQMANFGWSTVRIFLCAAKGKTYERHNTWGGKLKRGASAIGCRTENNSEDVFYNGSKQIWQWRIIRMGGVQL
jgi:hypothetical protein